MILGGLSSKVGIINLREIIPKTTIMDGINKGKIYHYTAKIPLIEEGWENAKWENSYWSAFGYIAAEADLARLNN